MSAAVRVNTIVQEILAYAKTKPDLAEYVLNMPDIEEAKIIFSCFMNESSNVRLTNDQLISKYMILASSYVDLSKHLEFFKPRLILLRELLG